MSRRRNTTDESPSGSQAPEPGDASAAPLPSSPTPDASPTAGASEGATSAPAVTITGELALGRDPRALARRLRRGSIAVIDAIDIDASSAEALADRGPAAVINLSPSVTGRFEARGAGVLLRRGIPLFDAVDRRLLAADEVRSRIDVRGPASRGAASRGPGTAGSEPSAATISAGALQAALRTVTEAAVAATRDQARAGAALRAPLIAAGALDVVQRDGAAIVTGSLVPGLDVDLAGREVLVVGAGAGYRAELKALRRAISERRMAIIATGDAAGAVPSRYAIDVLIGPFDSVPDDVLRRAKAVVVHGESHAVASTRLGALGVVHAASESRLEASDLGVALAASAGARLIVSAGRPSSLAGLLDSTGGASSLIARMAAGGAWIDAELFARLYRPRWSRIAQWLWLLLAAAALAGALSLHPSVRERVVDLWGAS